jgi:hypothetical protein
MRIDESPRTNVQMALEQQQHSLNQKLSLLELSSTTTSSEQNNSHQSLSPGPAASPTTLSPSGDESSSSAKKISFGKVFGRNEQPQSISSPSPTSATPLNTLNMNPTQNQSFNYLGNSSGQNNHRGSSVPGTPTSPSKFRNSSTSSTGKEIKPRGFTQLNWFIIRVRQRQICESDPQSV